MKGLALTLCAALQVRAKLVTESVTYDDAGEALQVEYLLLWSGVG